MNEIVNRFLLAGDKLMSEMHFKKTRFTYSVCGPFTKNKERIQKFKDTEDSRHIYQNQLDKACFKHDMILKITVRITASDEILHDKTFNLAKNTKYDRYQMRLASMVYKFLEKKLQVVLLKVKLCKTKN